MWVNITVNQLTISQQALLFTAHPPEFVRPQSLMDERRRVHSLSARSFKVLHVMFESARIIVRKDEIPKKVTLID